MASQSFKLQNEVNVTCPVCRGQKTNPYAAKGKEEQCKCCKGAGEITKLHKETLDRVRHDLSQKLEGRIATINIETLKKITGTK